MVDEDHLPRELPGVVAAIVPRCWHLRVDGRPATTVTYARELGHEGPLPGGWVLHRDVGEVDVVAVRVRPRHELAVVDLDLVTGLDTAQSSA